MGSEDKCCICFPLECGIMTLAVWSIIMAIAGPLGSYFWEGAMTIMWPAHVIEGIMAILWIVALAKPSEETRKFALLGFIALIVVAAHAYNLYLLLSGKLMDLYCHEETITQVNETIVGAGGTETVTVEECMLGGKNGAIGNMIFSFLLCIYFATAINRWAKNDEGWERA